MLEGGIGYIQIKSFQGNTYEDMRRALAQLHRQQLRGLVLDLRDNPGGLLEQAVRVADTFLTSGTIEERIWELQQRKAALSREVLGEDGFSRALDREALAYLLEES